MKENGLTCEEATELAERLIDGGLALGQEEILRAHLSVCPACKAKYALDLALVESIRRAPRQAFESVEGPVLGRVRVRERRRWVLRWGAAVAAVCVVAVLTIRFGGSLLEPVLGLLTGSFKSSPTYVALAKVGGLIVEFAAGLRSMILSGTAPGGLGSYAPQAAALALVAGAIVIFMMYGMGRWLRKPMEVNSWRNG